MVADSCLAGSHLTGNTAAGVSAAEVPATGVLTVGVLGLQGDARRHQDILSASGVTSKRVRQSEDLEQIGCLIMPGGESTTISMMLEANDLLQPLAAKIRAGMPVWGTCAGMILLAREVRGGRDDQVHLAAIDIVVERNAYGRQISSFEASLDIPTIGMPDFPAVFIRSPVVIEAGEEVEVLAEFRGQPVLCRQDNVLVSSFHPELTSDNRLHDMFLKEAAKCLDIQNGQLSNAAKELTTPNEASFLPSSSVR